MKTIYVVYVYANTIAGEHEFKNVKDALAAARFASHYQSEFSNIKDKNCTAVSYRDNTGTLAVSITKFYR